MTAGRAHSLARTPPARSDLGGGAGGRRRRARSLVLVLALALSSQAAAASPKDSEAARAILFLQDVAWSPDGEWIAFSGYAGPADEFQREAWKIFVSRADGSDARVVAEDAQWVSWSPDGRRLAFSSPRDGDRDLYLVDRDGNGLEQVTVHEASDSAPCWSPDGGRIAFTSTRDGNSEIYVKFLADGRLLRLTTNTDDDHNPVWSADGERLVFYRSFEGGTADQIYRISANGEAEERLTQDGDLHIYPSFLPDGRVAFFRKSGTGGEVRLVVLDPESSEELVLGPTGAFFARWSPDGGDVAFIAGKWPRSALYRMRADGKEIRKIVGATAE